MSQVAGIGGSPDGRLARMLADHCPTCGVPPRVPCVDLSGGAREPHNAWGLHETPFPPAQRSANARRTSEATHAYARSAGLSYALPGTSIARQETAADRAERSDRERAARRAQDLETLGLEQGATVDAVHAAFRARANERHPDHGGSEEAMAELVSARDRVLAYLGAWTVLGKAPKALGDRRSAP